MWIWLEVTQLIDNNVNLTWNTLIIDLTHVVILYNIIINDKEIIAYLLSSVLNITSNPQHWVDYHTNAVEKLLHAILQHILVVGTRLMRNQNML